jgi:hypothetical protein
MVRTFFETLTPSCAYLLSYRHDRHDHIDLSRNRPNETAEMYFYATRFIMPESKKK